ncbi:MAG: sulfatase [Planctomycetes bacterium]|nr:sulfatase [Planctomycetota bacterium]
MAGNVRPGIGGRVRAALIWGGMAAVAAAWMSLLESRGLTRSHMSSLQDLLLTYIKLAAAYGASMGAGVGLTCLILPQLSRHFAASGVAALALGMVTHHLGWGLIPSTSAMAFAALIAAWGVMCGRISKKVVVYLAIASAASLAPLPQITRNATSTKVGGAAEQPGNVLFVVIDTLRADHLSSWGYRAPGGNDEGVTSPFIDSVADSGWRFDQAYAQAPWTRPSAASYLTGLHPQSHAIATQFDRLSDDVPTLAEFLRDQGYRTAGFSANPQVSAFFGLTQGFDTFWNPGQYFQGRTFLRALVRSELVKAALTRLSGKMTQAAEASLRGIPGSDADAVNAAVEAWIRSEGISPRPTFLYLHYLDPHDPYNAPVDYLYGDLDSARQRDESVFHSLTTVPPRPLANSTMQATTPEELQGHIRRYDTEIRFVDQRLGEMMQRLQSEGIYRPDRDLLIITSDHGEEFYDHGQWLHGQSLYEEQIRVPLILRGPKIPSGTVALDPVQLIDLVPTIAAWIGSELPWPVQGVSLLSDPRPTGDERFVFSHRPREEYPIDMVRVGDRKLIRVERAPGNPVYMVVESVSTGDEPVTETPIENVPEELIGLLELYRETAAALRRKGSAAVELPPEMRESLIRLGYLTPDEG